MAAASNSLDDAGIAHRIVGDPVLFDIVFVDRDVANYRDYKVADEKRTAVYNASLRQSGILKPPGKIYPHLALTEEDLEQTEAALAKAAIAVAESG